MREAPARLMAMRGLLLEFARHLLCQARATVASCRGSCPVSARLGRPASPGSVAAWLRWRSEIERQFGGGPTAAHEDSAVRRRFERFGVVGDLAGEQAA